MAFWAVFSGFWAVFSGFWAVLVVFLAVFRGFGPLFYRLLLSRLLFDALAVADQRLRFACCLI